MLYYIIILYKTDEGNECMGNSMMKCRVLIMIAAYNEEANIEQVVELLQRDYPQYDYVIINDGSTDHTLERIQRRGYNYISLPINLGIGGAIQTGYRYAKEYNYDIAVQMDGDGQHDPAYIDDLIRPIVENQADYCVGSRFLKKEGFQSSGVRRVGIHLLSVLIHVLTMYKIYDVTSGFRAVNRKFIEIYADDYPDDYPEPKALVDAVMRRGRICEIPVIMRERAGGISSINWGRSIYYMIKVSLDIILCRVSYGIRREKSHQ